jgi:methylated-DNA--[protein]-cysteine S-methyltransferase
MRYVYFYNTGIKELGILGIGATEDKITDLFFEYEIENIKKSSNYIIKETTLIKKAASQLFEYLNGKRRDFNLPLLKEGTDFQISVWNELLKIPYGETRSYKDIAIAINNEKAVRAVGMANNRNKIPIFIPCHRIIGSNKKLVGYGGGLEIKEFLLNLEKRNSLKKIEK